MRVWTTSWKLWKLVLKELLFVQVTFLKGPFCRSCLVWGGESGFKASFPNRAEGRAAARYLICRKVQWPGRCWLSASLFCWNRPIGLWQKKWLFCVSWRVLALKRGLKVHSEQRCPSEGAACESQPLSYRAAAEQELKSTPFGQLCQRFSVDLALPHSCLTRSTWQNSDLHQSGLPSTSLFYLKTKF